MHLCRKTSHDGGYPAVELADALIQQTVGTVESGVRQERRAARHALARHVRRPHAVETLHVVTRRRQEVPEITMTAQSPLEHRNRCDTPTQAHMEQ